MGLMARAVVRRRRRVGVECFRYSGGQRRAEVERCGGGAGRVVVAVHVSCCGVCGESEKDVRLWGTHDCGVNVVRLCGTVVENE